MNINIFVTFEKTILDTKINTKFLVKASLTYKRSKFVLKRDENI